MKQKITPFLWFDKNAEEAINFYVSIFKNSRIISITRYSDFMPEMKGKVLTAVFELEGVPFMAIDGGPMYHFTEAISLQVDCDTQEEVDDLWNKLTADGGVEQCGWLKDKYGLSWQIVPNILGKLFSDPDSVKVSRMAKAMMQMKKLDIAALVKAFNGE